MRLLEKRAFKPIVPCFPLSIYFFIWLRWVSVVVRRIKLPGQGRDPGPRHWEHRVSPTGPPGKSLWSILEFFFFFSVGNSVSFVG